MVFFMQLPGSMRQVGRILPPRPRTAHVRSNPAIQDAPLHIWGGCDGGCNSGFMIDVGSTFMRSASNPFHGFWLAVVCSTLGPGVARAFTTADADTIFEAHTKAFYQVEGGKGWHRKSTDGDKKADYWTRAEMLEMVLDVHARTRNPKQLEMFEELFRGFIADHGRTWEKNDFYDDIMWMVIACARAHLATKNEEYLKVAKENFDLCYKRA